MHLVNALQLAIAADRFGPLARTLPVPLIGRIHGAALGGGAGLAAVAGVEIIGALVAGQMLSVGARSVIVLMLIGFIVLRRRTPVAAA